MRYEDIIDFWFNEIEQKDWCRKDPDFDQLIGERFLQIHNAAIKCEVFEWKKYPHENLEFEFKHKAIIDRYGRYPYRNKILGRQSTEAGLKFLKEPGSAF